MNFISRHWTEELTSYVLKNVIFNTPLNNRPESELNETCLLRVETVNLFFDFEIFYIVIKVKF